MADATVATPGKKSGVGKIVLLVVVLLIGYGIYKSAGNATPTTPEGVVDRMSRLMSEVESVEFAGTLDVNIEGTKNPLASLPGATSASDANKPVSFSLRFTGESEFGNWEKLNSSVQLTLSSPLLPKNGTAEFEFATIEGDRYFKLNTVPIIGTLNLHSLVNMWVQLDPKEGDDTTVPAATSTMNEETADKVKDIISGGKYFQVTEDLGEESLGGITTRHYKVTLNEAEVMRVARAVSTEVNGKAPSIEDEKKMNEFFTRAEMTNGEIWVGTKDYYLYKTLFGVTIAKTDTEPSSGTIAVELDLRNFNEKVMVSAPTGAKTMNEFMGAFVGAMLGGGGGLPAGFMMK